MSDDSKADGPKTKRKFGKIAMIGGALVVLLGGGAGAGLYASRAGLFGGSAAAAAEPDHPKLVAKADQKRPGEGGEGGHGGGEGGGEAAHGGAPTPAGKGGDRYASNYYALDKDFTANLQDSSHFIQVGIALSTPYDDDEIARIKTNDIAIRSAILLTLGDTTEEQVFTSAGKRQLQARLVQAINGVLQQKEGFGGVGNVYFTNFVVQ